MKNILTSIWNNVHPIIFTYAIGWNVIIFVITICLLFDNSPDLLKFKTKAFMFLISSLISIILLIVYYIRS